MISINNGSNGHVGPVGSSAVPDKFLLTIGKALTILLTKMRSHRKCNDDFRSLPGAQSFQHWFDDHTVWINYDPLNDGHLWGWTIPSTHPKDVVLTQYPLRMGVWSTAATIVHELAHLNGAPGAPSHAAENTVRSCRMMSPNGPYDPHIQG